MQASKQGGQLRHLFGSRHWGGVQPGKHANLHVCKHACKQTRYKAYLYASTFLCYEACTQLCAAAQRRYRLLDPIHQQDGTRSVRDEP